MQIELWPSFYPSINEDSLSEYIEPYTSRSNPQKWDFEKDFNSKQMLA